MFVKPRRIDILVVVFIPFYRAADHNVARVKLSDHILLIVCLFSPKSQVSTVNFYRIGKKNVGRSIDGLRNCKDHHRSHDHGRQEQAGDAVDDLMIFEY